MAKTCVTCQGPITSHGRDTKQCGACWTAARVFCTDCGVELDKRNQRTRQCRACWLKAHPPRFCEGCGEKMLRGARSASKRCMPCRIAAGTSLCLDCGTKLPKASRGKRCWPCHMKVRTEKIVVGCLVEGCERPHKAKGMCMTHYLTITRKVQGIPKGRSSRPKDWIGSQPCSACGYDKMRSDVHRAIPGKDGGQYVPGNMVPLCARCHAEVHRGVTPCPSPLLPPN